MSYTSGSTYLCELLAASTEIIVSNLIEVLLLGLAIDRVALGVDDCIGSNDTVRVGVDGDHRALHSTHAAADVEDVAFADRSIGFKKVGLEIDVEKVAGKTLDRVGKGEDVDSASALMRINIPLAVLDVVGRRHMDEIGQLDGAVTPCHYMSVRLAGGGARTCPCSWRFCPLLYRPMKDR